MALGDKRTVYDMVNDLAPTSATPNSVVKANENGYLDASWLGGAKTEPPVLAIGSTVNENDSLQGTITNYDSNATYFFTTGFGSIKYVDGNTFYYYAGDITDNVDHTVTVNCYATKPGELRSENTILTITVKYVPMIADDAYVDNLTTNDAEYNNGWEVQ